MYESWNFRFLFVFCFDNVRFFTLARLAAFAATVLVFEKTNLPQQQSKMHSFWPTSAIYLPYTLHNRLPCYPGRNLLECIEWSKIVNNSRHMQVWKTEQLLFVNMGFNRVNRLFNPMMFWICACHTLGFDWRPSIAAASTSPSHHVWNFLASFFWQFQV